MRCRSASARRSRPASRAALEPERLRAWARRCDHWSVARDARSAPPVLEITASTAGLAEQLLRRPERHQHAGPRSRRRRTARRREDARGTGVAPANTMSGSPARASARRRPCVEVHLPGCRGRRARARCPRSRGSAEARHAGRVGREERDAAARSAAATGAWSATCSTIAPGSRRRPGLARQRGSTRSAVRPGRSSRSPVAARARRECRSAAPLAETTSSVPPSVHGRGADRVAHRVAGRERGGDDRGAEHEADDDQSRAPRRRTTLRSPS